MSTSTSQPEDSTVLDPTDTTDTTDVAEAQGTSEGEQTSVTDETTRERNDETAEVDEAIVTDEVAEAEEVTAEGAGRAAPVRSAGSAAQDLVREGEIAADFLETLLDIADLDGDLEVDVDGDRAAVAIVDSEDGAAPRRLVGPGGEVLEALQELTRLAVQAETGDRSRLMLDVAGYRADRRDELVKTAQQAIAQVKESGERRELEPMTAFERKVVHDEVLAAGLHSESEGAEPGRYVVILPGS